MIGDHNDDDKDKKEDDGEGESSKGTFMVGGAVSKSDNDAKMTKKQQSRIMRATTVAIRSMSDVSDAMDKARSGQFNTLDSEIKKMDGQGLYQYMSSNPSHMDKIGNEDVRQTMINDGYGKQLDNLTHGTYEAAQKDGRKDIINTLMITPIEEMTPDQQSYIWDKLSELGAVSGEFDGSPESLQAAVGVFVMSSAAGEQLVKDGHIQISPGREQWPDAPEVKPEFDKSSDPKAEPPKPKTPKPERHMLHSPPSWM